MADARHVFDGTFGEHRAEGDDTRHVVLAVGVLNVFVGEVQVLEVHVDIRHGDAVRIEEALEQQVVLQRIQVGDPETVGHHTAGGRTAARAYHVARLARCADVILHDQEVVRETHLADGLQLEVDPALLLRGERFAVADFGALVGQVAQISH